MFKIIEDFRILLMQKKYKYLPAFCFEAEYSTHPELMKMKKPANVVNLNLFIVPTDDEKNHYPNP